jgi:N-hydroxyarylamine O-acetyltransferase
VPSADKYEEDAMAGNEWQSTRPSSKRPIRVYKDEVQVKRLLGRTYSVDRPGRPEAVAEVDEGQLGTTLRAEFGLALTAHEVAGLLAAAAPR